MRSGGLALVTIVFLGALARVWAPSAQGPAGGQPKPVPASRASRAKDTDQKKRKKTTAKSGETGYRLALQEKIRDFFGQEHSPDVIAQESSPACLRPDHWCVPQEKSAKILFVIATVPDPVHTHLSLFFDRNIDAIEQGATSEGFTFDRAIMPWHYLEDPNSEESEDQAKLRESYPGLLIFRSDLHTALFVFVVGETPTSGINEEQFHRALGIIHDIRRGIDALVSLTEPEFGILGPTFSGSLSSLSVILTSYLADLKNIPDYSRGRTLPVYASVMGTASIKSFERQIPKPVRLSIFEQDATAILAALDHFVSVELHYQEHDVAVLNEDETAYGNSFVSLEPASPSGFPRILTLSFPRGISQFRSAYSKEFQSNSPQADSTNTTQQPQNNLRLDLGVTGSDDDSVAPYAKAQTPLSQEGIMLAILSELHRHEPKFILLRATDPLDELFLARYLRDKYPQGRLVIPSPDLLFPRAEGGQLDGVLAVNTYPLSPARMNQRLGQSCGKRKEREEDDDSSPVLFSASSAAALYNATSMLVKRLTLLDSATQTGNLSKTQPPSVQPKKMPILVNNPTGGAGTAPPDSPCTMSPNLWLTVLSGNSIHPIRVLPAQALPSFPKIDTPLPVEKKQRDTRTPPTWYFSFVLCLGLLVFHHRRSWTGGTLGHWQTQTQFDPPGAPLSKKAMILCLGGILLVGIYVVLASVNTPVSDDVSCSTVLLNVLVWVPLAVFAGFTCWDFWKRRGEHFLCGVFLISTLLAAAIGVIFAHHLESAMVLWQQRALDLTSGVSPATPLLVLLAGLYSWFLYSLRGESFTDWRWPYLPESTGLPAQYSRLAEIAGCVRNLIRPISAPWWISGIPVGLVAGLALMSMLTAPGHVPVRSLEGRPFDIAYSFLLCLSLMVLIGTLLRLIALWREFRLVLTGLDRMGLKDALKRLCGFEWTVIWNPAWSVEKEGYKLVSREFQTIERLGASLGEPADTDPGPIKALRTLTKEILEFRNQMLGKLGSSEECPSETPSATALMKLFTQIQAKFAETAGVLITSFLDKSWQHLPAEDGSKGADDKKAGSSCTEINVGTAVIQVGTPKEEVPPPLDPSGLRQNSLRLAEEFVACVYSNFLVTVLLRIRGLVFSAVVVYVCITFSAISYPFQPAPDLNTLAIVLFLCSGVVIGYAYEEMHRDATLSRMTSTDPGKLDSAFWTKFVTAGSVPLVALLSTVYPPFGHLLYTLVGPLLQALR